MSLTGFLNESNAGYYEVEFRRVLEEHLALIKNRSTSTLPVDPNTSIRYKGDFFGLLITLNVPRHLHWITMRINGMTSPSDANDDIRSVVVVDPSYINTIFNTHRTQSKRKVKNK